MATTNARLTRDRWVLAATGPATVLATVSQAFAYASTAGGEPTIHFQHQWPGNTGVPLEVAAGEFLYFKTDRADAVAALDIVPGA